MRGLIGDLRIKTYLVNQNPAETCQVFGKNFSGQLYVGLMVSNPIGGQIYESFFCVNDV
jgi:hypothetical protein